MTDPVASPNHVDGGSLRADHGRTADVVVVGSGPAGSAVARELARAGASVVVVEEGPWVRPAEFPLSGFEAFVSLYRDMGTSVAWGKGPIPFLQGRMVGGSSPINGAICWRMPRDRWEDWCAADPALRDALPWDELETATDLVEHRIGVRPTSPEVAGRKNLLMARGADALGLEHRPIRRNEIGCRGSGRCLQGCPVGAKQSVDATLLADAMEAGAVVLSRTEVLRVLRRGRRANEVVARAEGGAIVRLRARLGVVLAASAIQTPLLLQKSGIGHGPVGRHLQCHPGVSLLGRFREPVRMWEGATQGHEVTGLRHERLKFEVLGFDLSVLAARLDGAGSELARGVADMAHWLDWGVAVRAEGQGRVRSVLGRTVVTWSPTPADVRRFRRGLRVMGDMMLAAGAEELIPGVRGFDARVSSPARLRELEESGPDAPSAFTGAATHLFGTCRMGGDAATSVVRPDFRHHAVDGLWVADSSVFPTNLGVNPQVPIMAMATLCARRVLAADAPSAGAPAPRRNDMSEASNRSDAGASAAATPTTSPTSSTSPGASSSVSRTAVASPDRRIGLDDLLRMDRHELHAIIDRAHPLDPDALAGHQYQGIDLSLPPWVNRILWKTFRKTFHRDPATGAVRGWNVRMEQQGIDGPRVPKRRGGATWHFAHYELRSAVGERFPRGWQGPHFLDYGRVGNPFGENLGWTPLVAVNEGDMSLLLGWEVFRLGPLFVPLRDYWALRLEGPLEEVFATPRDARAARAL